MRTSLLGAAWLVLALVVALVVYRSTDSPATALGAVLAWSGGWVSAELNRRRPAR